MAVNISYQALALLTAVDPPLALAVLTEQAGAGLVDALLWP